MVDYGYDPEYGNLWDQHNAAGQNFPHVCEMAKRPYHLAGVDRAFAALLEDLAARGRLAETLVVYLTDFGRTPKINKQGGRDHWGRSGSIFFAGGGGGGRAGDWRDRLAGRQPDDGGVHPGRHGRDDLRRPRRRPGRGAARPRGAFDSAVACRPADQGRVVTGSRRPRLSPFPAAAIPSW